VLSENIDLLHTMAAALLERETLTAEDIKIMARGEKLPPLSRGGSSLTPARAAGDPKPGARAPAQPAAAGGTGAFAGVSRRVSW
jgi:cell division protease FtsH